MKFLDFFPQNFDFDKVLGGRSQITAYKSQIILRKNHQFTCPDETTLLVLTVRKYQVNYYFFILLIPLKLLLLLFLKI